jgi:hypothetical protein
MFFFPFLLDLNVLFIYKHYNKRCPYMPSDFTGFWANSLVVMNGDQWKNSEFTSLVNGD